MTSDIVGQPCPCGNGAVYQVCCGPLHNGEREAVTAEELMRSRYSAYAKGLSDYVFRTWRTRKGSATTSSAPGIHERGPST